MNFSKMLVPMVLIAISLQTVAQDPQHTLPSLSNELLLLERERVCRRHLTKLEKPTYPEDAQKAGIQGQVLVFVWFDKTGKLVDAKILRSPGESLSNAVLIALKSWRIAPDAPLYPEANYMSELRFVFVLNNGNAEVADAAEEEQERVSPEFTKEVESRKKKAQGE
jgi:TonB family protein